MFIFITNHKLKTLDLINDLCRIIHTMYSIHVFYKQNNVRMNIICSGYKDSALAGDVDVPQSCERVCDDLILYPPDCGVPHPLVVAAAVSHRGRAASPVVVQLGQVGEDVVRSAEAETGEAVVVVDSLAHLRPVQGLDVLAGGKILGTPVDSPHHV